MEPAAVFYTICKKPGDNSINYCAKYAKYDTMIRIFEFFNDKKGSF